MKRFDYAVLTTEAPDKNVCNEDQIKLDRIELFDMKQSDRGNRFLQIYGIYKYNGLPLPVSPYLDEVVFATCSPKKNRIVKKRNVYNVSPDGVSSLDEYVTTINYETNSTSGGRRMSITISDSHSNSEISSEPALISESHETSSLVTQSTNCSPLASSMSLPSTKTTCKILMCTAIYCKPSEVKHSFKAGNTLDSKHSKTKPQKSVCHKIGEEADDVITSQENLNLDLNRRRHAINITNNPGYCKPSGYRVSF